ncbi:MAG: stage II sporulation protein M, partial [Armatimonadota bacterium]
MSGLARAKRWLTSVYLREIPRIVKEQRWTLLVVGCVYVLWAVLIYDTGREADMDEALKFFEGMYGPRWYHPALPSASWGVGRYTWLWFFSKNTGYCLLSFFFGAATLGMGSIGLAIASGGDVGWIVGLNSGMARQASGAGLAGTAVGILLPHGVLELPAIWLALALGLRAGLAWVRPLRSLRRWASVKRLVRDYCVALLAIVPLLLIAAFLEAYATPILFDRYVMGIGAYPAMSQERRIGRRFLASNSAWSPDGKRLATLGLLESSVEVVSVDGGGRLVVLAEEEESKQFSVPSWSPDGDRLVLAHRFMEYERRGEGGLVIVDVATRRVERVEGGPTGRYYGAAWSPDGESIAATISDPLGERDRGTNLWVLHLGTGQWEQITHLALPVRIAPLTYPSWSPDGEEIAFIRLTGPESADREDEAEGAERYSFDLCAVRRDGSRVRTITPVGPHSVASWSPTGEWIAFHAGAEWTDRLADAEKAMSEQVILEDVGLVRPDGSERIDGLTRADLHSSLSWSPDGTQLLYHRIS